MRRLKSNWSQEDKWKLLTWATHRSIDSFPYFLNWVWTLDTADASAGNRIKKFPRKRYILKMAELIQNGPKLQHLVKSRQLMMSWLHAAYLAHGCLRPGFYGYIQSKKFEDSNDFIRDRVHFIWENLPKWLRFIAMEGKGIEGHVKEGRFVAPNGSRVVGVGQGGDQFRGYVPTFIFMDEVGMWDQFDETLTSIPAILQKGAKAVACSTARPGPWGEIVENQHIRGPKEKVMRGLWTWELEYGGSVIDLSYEADPEKDPETEEGRAWYEEEIRKYPGGPQGPKWLQEMERDFGAHLGDLMYPQYSDDDHVVKDFPIPSEWPKWRAADWGNRNETAVLWIAEDPVERVYYVYREFYKPSRSIQHTKNIIHDRSGTEMYLASWIDPATDRHDSKEVDSVYYMLNQEPMPFRCWKADRSAAGRELVNQWLYDYRLMVFESCVNTRKEFQNYRYDEWAPGAQGRHNLKETPRKKMDHTMNALKYFANGVRHREKVVKEKAKPKGPPRFGTLGWLLNRNKRVSRTIGGPSVVRELS